MTTWKAEVRAAMRKNLGEFRARPVDADSVYRSFLSTRYQFLGERHPIVDVRAVRARGWAACADATAAIAAAAIVDGKPAVLCLEAPASQRSYTHLRALVGGRSLDPYDAYRAAVPRTCEFVVDARAFLAGADFGPVVGVDRAAPRPGGKPGGCPSWLAGFRAVARQIRGVRVPRVGNGVEALAGLEGVVLFPLGLTWARPLSRFLAYVADDCTLSTDFRHYAAEEAAVAQVLALAFGVIASMATAGAVVDFGGVSLPAAGLCAACSAALGALAAILDAVARERPVPEAAVSTLAAVLGGLAALLGIPLAAPVLELVGGLALQAANDPAVRRLKEETPKMTLVALPSSARDYSCPEVSVYANALLQGAREFFLLRPGDDFRAFVTPKINDELRAIMQHGNSLQPVPQGAALFFGERRTLSGKKIGGGGGVLRYLTDVRDSTAVRGPWRDLATVAQVLNDPSRTTPVTTIPRPPSAGDIRRDVVIIPSPGTGGGGSGGKKSGGGDAIALGLAALGAIAAFR